MPIIEHRPVSRVKSQSNWLINHSSSVTSQLGQDGIISQIFKIINSTNKVCVEFGAGNGVTLSNTWNLLKNEGWRGVLIEANHDRFQALKTVHTEDGICLINDFVQLSGPRSIDQIMTDYGELSPDFMSIDIDGIDWHVWNSMVLTRPRLILIEFNPTVPNDVYFVQDAEGKISQGASLLAFIELGRAKGYSLICVDQWDAFFIRDDYFSAFDIEDNSIDSMFYSSLETKIFQCFDGKLYTVGNKRLLWSGVDFDQERLQVLPIHRQVYGDKQQAGD